MSSQIMEWRHAGDDRAHHQGSVPKKMLTEGFSK